MEIDKKNDKVVNPFGGLQISKNETASSTLLPEYGSAHIITSGNRMAITFNG
jgi:hypothetical protein